MTRRQIEELSHAMDYTVKVMHEIEETGKDKRIAQKLDKAVGILYDVIQSKWEEAHAELG